LLSSTWTAAQADLASTVSWRWNAHTPYALRALEAELALVAVAPNGRRNEQLNASSYALFRLVADDRLPCDVVVRGLEAAARHAGLHRDEGGSAGIAKTIASAARARGVQI
jgi:hypothetical protein